MGDSGGQLAGRRQALRDRQVLLRLPHAIQGTEHAVLEVPLVLGDLTRHPVEGALGAIELVVGPPPLHPDPVVAARNAIGRLRQLVERTDHETRNEPERDAGQQDHAHDDHEVDGLDAAPRVSGRLIANHEPAPPLRLDASGQHQRHGLGLGVGPRPAIRVAPRILEGCDHLLAGGLVGERVPGGGCGFEPGVGRPDMVRTGALGLGEDLLHDEDLVHEPGRLQVGDQSLCVPTIPAPVCGPGERGADGRELGDGEAKGLRIRLPLAPEQEEECQEQDDAVQSDDSRQQLRAQRHMWASRYPSAGHLSSHARQRPRVGSRSHERIPAS